jgi:hypothetical protein
MTFSFDHQNPVLLLTWSTKNYLSNQPFSPQLISFVVSVVIFYYNLPPFCVKYTTPRVGIICQKQTKPRYN